MTLDYKLKARAETGMGFGFDRVRRQFSQMDGSYMPILAIFSSLCLISLSGVGLLFALAPAKWVQSFVTWHEYVWVQLAELFLIVVPTVFITLIHLVHVLKIARIEKIMRFGRWQHRMHFVSELIWSSALILLIASIVANQFMGVTFGPGGWLLVYRSIVLTILSWGILIAGAVVCRKWLLVWRWQIYPQKSVLSEIMAMSVVFVVSATVAVQCFITVRGVFE